MTLENIINISRITEFRKHPQAWLMRIWYGFNSNEWKRTEENYTANATRRRRDIVRSEYKQKNEIDLIITKNKILKSKSLQTNKIRSLQNNNKTFFNLRLLVKNYAKQDKSETGNRGQKNPFGENRRLEWQKWTNAELYKLFKEVLISHFIKTRRMKWLTHLERMSQERDVKSIASKIRGCITKDRPRKKSRDPVEEYSTEKNTQLEKKSKTSQNME